MPKPRSSRFHRTVNRDDDISDSNVAWPEQHLMPATAKLADHILDIAQESMANAVKHIAAKYVRRPRVMADDRLKHWRRVHGVAAPASMVLALAHRQVVI